MTPADLIGFGKQLGDRISVTSLLPGLTLALLVLALVWSGAPADAPDLGAIIDRAEKLSAWEGGLLVLAVAIVTLFTQPLQLSLVRLFEGYWGTSRVGSALAAPGIARHTERRDMLLEARKPTSAQPDDGELARMYDAAAVLRLQYPPADVPVLPTALGNALRATESRAGQRYGLDTVTAWPRLYPQLDDGLRATIDAQRDQLDTAARFCATFALSTVVAVALLVPHGGWWMSIALVTALLAWGSYRAAIAAARSYGEVIYAAFDLHRFDLLAALHLPLPVNSAAERAANRSSRGSCSKARRRTSSSRTARSGGRRRPPAERAAYAPASAPRTRSAFAPRR